MTEIITVIVGLIILIMFIIIYFAIIKIRDNTDEITRLLSFLAKGQKEHMTTSIIEKWDEWSKEERKELIHTFLRNSEWTDDFRKWCETIIKKSYEDMTPKEKKFIHSLYQKVL